MKRVHSTKISTIYICLLVAALLLSACGGSETPAATQAAVPTTAPAATEAAVPTTAPAATQAAAPTTAPVATQAPPPGPTPDANIPPAVLPTPAPGEPAAIANFNTAIFGGPGTSYVVYGAFLGGETAKVVGKSSDGLWWAISMPVAPTGSGWVDAAWVTVSNVDSVAVLPTPPVPPSTEMIPPGPSDPQATTIANAYVRSGPAATFPAYGVAPAGLTGRVIGKSEDGLWWVVRLNPQNIGAGYGWVETQYTTALNVEGVPVVQSPPATSSEAPPPPPAGAPAVTADDALNVRSGPGTNYPVLVVAPAGTSGAVSGKSADGQWWQVKISTKYAADGFGWVSADYVTTQNTDSVPVVAAPAAPPPVAATPPPNGSGSCVLVSQNPLDGTAFGPSAPFNTTWVLKNIGTQNWDATQYDVVFGGAVNNVYLHTGPDRYDLPTSVQPGATYNFSVPMMAPFTPGTYSELWQVIYGSQVICPFYVNIVVN
jgi:uncharacterized protein YraI